MTEAQAKAEGCTHHGTFLGFPAWFGDLESDCPLVILKLELLDWLMPLWIGLFNVFAPDEDGFTFVIEGEID